MLLLAAAVEAQPPVPVYEVGAGELSIDGSLEDWRRLSIPSLTEQDLTLFPFPLRREPVAISPPGAPELTFDLRLAWSAEPGRIFAAFDIVDDDPHVEVPGKTWPAYNEVDYVAMGVDGDHGGGRFSASGGWEDCWLSVEDAIETEAWECIPDLYYNQRVAQLYEVFPDPNGFSIWNQNGFSIWNQDVARWPSGFDPWVLEGSITAAAARVESGVSTRTTIEVMVTPFDTLDFRGPEYSTPSRLAAGQTIGLIVFVLDADPEGDRPTHLYRLGDANQFHMSRAESFADALLVPADRRTTVEETTWGRLKGTTAAGD